jgi:hypothetical protein
MVYQFHYLMIHRNRNIHFECIRTAQSGVAVGWLAKHIPRIHSLIVRAVTFKVSPSILYSLGTYCCYFASSLCFSRHVTAVTWPMRRRRRSYHLPPSPALKLFFLRVCR